MPKTTLGKWAVGLFAVGILFNLLGPVIPWPGGNLKYLYMTLGTSLGMAIPTLAILAIRKQGEKAVLVWIALILSAAAFLFSVLFLAGEVFIGHD